MARGRLFSRKHHEPAEKKPLESSPNPLVQLGLAFKHLQILAPNSSPASDSDTNPPERRKPLVDINEARKYIREKLAIIRFLTISFPRPDKRPLHPVSDSGAYEHSETTHVSSKHAFSSDPSSLPQHDAATGSNVFDIGTIGHPILEVRNPSREEVGSSTASYSWIIAPISDVRSGTRAKLDMNDVQEFVRGALEVVKRFENWGLPETSWENKMPWHDPPPKILARGLQRPPEKFDSEEERLAFNRQARKRKKFLTGCPPTWSFMVANFALIAFLVYNPLG